jgi:putative addiction module CopG family antidote
MLKNMSRELPPDVEALVRGFVATGNYASADDVLRDALRVFAELTSRHEQLLADVREGVQEADQGLVRPLDVEALIDRCALKLAAEGVTD